LKNFSQKFKVLRPEKKACGRARPQLWDRVPSRPWQWISTPDLVSAACLSMGPGNMPCPANPML
jgi:hypothetical protein